MGTFDKFTTLDNPTINLGAGNDKVIVTGNKFDLDSNSLDGGEGIDTIVLQGADLKLSLDDVLNVEYIDMRASSGATGNQTVGVSIDYLNDNINEVYIQGDVGDTVDFGNNGGNGVDNGARDNADGTKSYRDGDSGASTMTTGKDKWNVWTKLGTKEVGGITYDQYTHTTATGDNSGEYVFVQQGINII